MKTKIFSLILSAAMLIGTMPAASVFASSAADDAAKDAAERLIESQKYNYDPSGADLASGGAYPKSFDLRNADLDGSGVKKNYVTPVKSQGYFGACWGFGATAAAETSILTDLGMSYDEWNDQKSWDMDLSEHHLVWFTNTSLPEDDGDQGGEGRHILDPLENNGDFLNLDGSSVTATSVYSAGIGPVPEYRFPFRGKEGNILYRDPETGKRSTEPQEGYEPYCYSPYDDWSIDENDRFGQAFQLEESFMLPSPAQFEYDETEKKYKYVYDQAGTDAIKEQLVNGRPVCICYASDISVAPEKGEGHYINPATWAHYAPLSYKEDIANGARGDHTVAIVGWDDSFPKENFFDEPPADGAWIVKNSWGSDENEFPNKRDWGDHGYFYISYYDHTITDLEALDFIVRPDESAGDAYYSFKYDYMPNFSYKNNVFDAPASMANTFENDGTDVIAKTLTFYTELPNTETTFKMYMLSDQSASPTDGELLASGTKTYPYGGYHRYDLEEPVYIPADTKFSVVVTSKTADGKYEIASNDYVSELCARAYKAIYNFNTDYGKGVVNKGESLIMTTDEKDGAEWADWSETIAADNRISEKCLENIGFTDLLTQTEAALKEYNSASDEYRASHPEYDGNNIPEELETVYDQWKQKSVKLNATLSAIMDGNTDALGLSPEDAEGFSDAALLARDNFPITVIADAVKRDHILYYDSATGRLYTKMNYDTKEFSEPIDSFPGAICEGNKLTLTSEFQFVTTAKDGLFIDGGTTLYVPEGENPSIVSAADGFKGDDKLNEYTGIFAADGSTIDIDGSLTVRSGTGTDASGRAILSDGDLTITGDGSLNAICGDTEHDETAEPIRADSLAIYVYGDLDISVAEARFSAGRAHGLSYGIVTDPTHSVTIDKGASVTAQSSENLGDGEFYDKFYSYACVTSYLTVKDNSSFIASAIGENENESRGLIIFCGDVFGDGKIYNGGITLKNNSSLTVSANNSENGAGISSFQNAFLPVEMDSTCTFIAEGKAKASGADLSGVVAVSQDGEILSYTRGTDKLTNSYVDKQGNIAKYIEFKNAEDVSEGDKILYFDGETGKLYSKYDFHTGEMSDPVEVPGAICEKNKLTLTSDFRFVTAHEDGLYLSPGATLYVPEGETPYIHSAAAGFTRTDTSICASGINVRGDLTLDIDGTLTAIAGDGVNIDSFGVACEGNLKITGKGTLNAFGGNTSYDESVQDGQTSSAGILAYENIDISNAEVNAYGGDSHDDSDGIETWENGCLTISGGSSVKAEGGSCTDTEYTYAGIGCDVGQLVIKDNSSLIASSVRDNGVVHVGLRLNGEFTDADGTIYKSRIKLENNSTLTVRTANATNDYAIYLFDGPFEGAIKTEMDDTCTFTSEGDVAGFVYLQGVRATSEGEVLTFDSDKWGCYVDADGNVAEKITFLPETTSHSGGSGSVGFGGSSFSTGGAAPSASPNPTGTAAPQVSDAPAMPFTDVDPSDWFYDAVNSAYSKGLVNGVSGTEFGPDENMTRGMIVTIIGRADGSAESIGALMSDVDPNEYYAPYVAWAAANGIVTGFEDGTFRPDENVTREQTATILYRYAQYKGGDVSVGESANMSFTDAAQISEYAVPAILWACGAGIINGYPDGTLAPAASITRAEFVTMISRTTLL